MFLRIPFSSDVLGFCEVRTVKQLIIMTKGVGVGMRGPPFRLNGKETMSSGVPGLCYWKEKQDTYQCFR